jgi:hypothetical protein
MPLTPLTVLAVEVVATKPAASDHQFLARARRDVDQPTPAVTYVVRIQLESAPPATGSGWALYVGDLRIPKYWQYPSGIYFKVYDPAFFDEHGDSPIRFSADHGVTYTDTGVTLGRPRTVAGTGTDPDDLPAQPDILQ